MALLAQSDFGDERHDRPHLDVPKVTSQLVPAAEATLIKEGFKVVRGDTESDAAAGQVLTRTRRRGCDCARAAPSRSR